MTEIFDIAGYARISFEDDDIKDKDNTSIENQKAIITDFVHRKFPGSRLTFYEDRDRSGYTFETRENYQRMRRDMMTHKIGILVVKDFSRFSRRNSRGLVELEDLRDAGVRIISIGDNIDYPNDDDWLKIQFQFLINEMPVTDTSKKVRSVIRRRQEDGKWICAAPYGYIVNLRKEFELVPTEADVVRRIFRLYNEKGWGYKKIANHLTEQGIPTPRMSEKQRKDAMGQDNKIRARVAWSIVSVQGILDNDFYIGTFRAHKYTRRKINGSDIRLDAGDNVVIENHHQPIIDYRTFATTRALREKRTTANYRGVKKDDNVYSGFLFCGDCGSPMFAMSRSDLKPAYTCGTYHCRGRFGCTSHHIRADRLDECMKLYVKKMMKNVAPMLEQLNGEHGRALSWPFAFADFRAFSRARTNCIFLLLLQTITLQPKPGQNKKALEANMKATGIVRRIDDLGRVVIPKEIRRTLRIREGDPLEIYTEKDGEVIFKKYSPMGELQDFAARICDSIGKNTGHIAAVADRDVIIAVAGAPKRDLLDKRNSAELEQLMEQRKSYRFRAGDTPLRPAESAERYRLGVAAPIISEGDLLGCVMLLMNENDAALGESEQKLAQTVAGFLGRQMES